MVFAFRIDTKEEQSILVYYYLFKDQSLKESTSGCVTIKSEISPPPVTQGICDLLAGEKEENTHSINLQ